jgi:hypothetical protein
MEKAIPGRCESLIFEIERLRAEVEQISETTRSRTESADSSDFPDPSEDSSVWNLNSICVLMWKSIFWPTGKQWSHDKEHFENHKSSSKIQIRSRSQYWVESNVCPLLFTCVPMALIFIEICILSGIMDQGTNVKTHIYGDGYYQSPVWRYSSTSYLRTRFVPQLDNNGSEIGITSSEDVFKKTMLQDRPEGEAKQCMADDYLMPFNRYQVHPNRRPTAFLIWNLSIVADPPFNRPQVTADDAAFTKFWSLVADFRARPDAMKAFTHCLPWEYAALCATLWRANDAAAANTSATEQAAGACWRPAPCYPSNIHGREQMSAALWDSLKASPEELLTASVGYVVPKSVEGSLTLARCASPLPTLLTL